MRLITHNLLKSSVRGTKNGYPLVLEPAEVEVIESPFNREFIENILGKLEWTVLVQAAKTVDVTDLPEQLREEDKGNLEVLQRIHHALLDVHVITGELICPSTGRRFQITKGIPNMLLHEDEVVDDDVLEGAASTPVEPGEAEVAKDEVANNEVAEGEIANDKVANDVVAKVGEA